MQSSTPHPAPPRRAWIGLLMASLGALGFSGKAIIVKLGYRHGADAITLLGLRMLFALPLFLGLAWWAGRGRAALTRRDWWAVIGLGFSGYYLASFLDFAGLAYISASFERLILYLNPTLVLLLGWLLLGRRVGARQGAALAISYAGVLWVFAQELHWQGEHVWLGALLVLGSAISYALYLLFSGEEVHRLGAMRLTGLATSVACLLCVGQYLLLRGPGAIAQVPAAVLQLSVLNAVLSTFAPVLLVMLAIERLGAAVAAQTGMLGPMATIALGAWLLDEPLTTGVLGGTVLVLGGILLLNRWR
ncbi:DMT family transporter [Mitsuaria sp. WAJ17]|uniref:DMT family transporter n=1 Tax=Mitsuaria sp. WAJ17 TaxID=2761452 RepID=UPI0016003B5C|nr:DMT family transporter [Mitsuaria sp. WAJ17]MBB2486884.1 DMT family transporter [Mitsuaria sp. WAJ17]